MRLLLCAWLGCAVSLCAADSKNPLGNGPQVVEAGRTVYNQTCTVCHGVDGDAGDRAPALGAARRYAHNTEEDIFNVVLNGIPGTQMPSMGLSEEDAWRITAWIRSLRAVAADFPPDGDVAAGEKVFWGKGECGRCHRINGRGGLLGPDLSNLGGGMRLSAIRESLTVPKPHVPLGFRPATVVTKDGRTIRGVLKNEHNFSIQMLGDDDRLHLLTSDEIASIERGETSLMPTDYDKRLSETEFRDLVAFLSRLTKRAAASE
ncbi:MAG: c-type cytochrome [Acidobacteria bacterium]|nr:c-type cytochrome [Acidobacteriota bacterium]